MTRYKLIIILALTLTCQPDRRPQERRERERAIAIGYLLGCQFSSTNPLFSHTYYQRYSSDRNQYEKLIIGDSTFDIACNSFTNYAQSGTGCFPVSGNKIPDFQTQLCVLNTIAPQAIIISTMGGNDLLAAVPDSQIIQSGKDFVQALNGKYPNATKVWVKVHPTRVDYANQHRSITNPAITNYANSNGWKITDPDSCFMVDSDGRALQSYLLDSIHPNESTSNCIKTKIKTEHGILY